MRKRNCRTCLGLLDEKAFADVCSMCYVAFLRRECICVAVRLEGRHGEVVCPKHGPTTVEKPSPVLTNRRT